MINALQKDHAIISQKQGPALERVKIITSIDNLLRKRPIQNYFLENKGLEILSDWINENPDGGYPLPQVVESVFDILERLPIDTRFLEDSSIAKVVSRYAHGQTELKYLSNRALNIIQKW